MNTLQVFKSLYADSRKVFEAPDVDFGKVIDGRSGWLRERARCLDGKIVFEHFSDGIWRFSDEISKRDDWRRADRQLRRRVIVSPILKHVPSEGSGWFYREIDTTFLDKSKTYKLVAVEK
jgi:hypothetical protein